VLGGGIDLRTQAAVRIARRTNPPPAAVASESARAGSPSKKSSKSARVKGVFLHTSISRPIKAGVRPKEAQALARHPTITPTMGRNVEHAGNPVGVAALQDAHEVRGDPDLETVQPWPCGERIEGVRDQVLAPARGARRPTDLHRDPVQ
jgi:hypothetical protein